MHTKKIIHVASSHLMGLTAQETELAIAYKNLNLFESVVVTGENEQFEGCFKRLYESGVKNIVIPGFDEHRKFLTLIRDFTYQCNSLEPQAVTVNTNWQLLIVGVARFFCKRTFKIIYTIHGFRHNKKIKSFIALLLIGILLFLFADVINAPTSYVAKKFRFFKYKIISIPLGEDSFLFNNSSPIKFKSKLCIIFPAQFRTGKNHDLLVYAIRDYIEQTGDKNIALYLPGTGDMLSAIKKIVNNIGINKYVEFPGKLNREEIFNLYNYCQIAVVPSNSETFGHCVAEPLVMQRILITRRVGVAIDVVEDNENGFFFESKEDLVCILKRIRKMNCGELTKISKKAKKTGEIFRWENIAIRHYNEYFK